MHPNLKKQYDKTIGSSLSFIPKEIMDLIEEVNKTYYEIDAADIISDSPSLSFLQLLPDPAYAMDKNGFITAWNPAIENLTGVMAEEIIGKGNFEASLVFHKKRQPGLIDIVRGCQVCGNMDYSSIRRRGNSLAAEAFTTNLLSDSGTHLWVQAAPIHDPDGNIIGAFETVRDITPRKQSENINILLYRIAAELNADTSTVAFFKFIHNILMEFICAKNFFIALIDEDSNSLKFPYFVDETDSYDDITDISKHKSCKLCLKVLKSGLPLLVNNDEIKKFYNEDPSACPRATSWLGVPLKIGKKVIGIITLKNYDGSYSYNNHDVDLMTAVSGQIASCIQRKKAEQNLLASEEKYRSIFENAIECIFQVSAEGVMEVVNPAMAAFMGYNSTEELLAQRPKAEDYFLNKFDYISLCDKLFKRGSVTGFNVAINHRDQHERWAIINVRLVKNNNLSVSHISGAAFDTTPHILAQRRIVRHKSRFMQLFDRSPQAIVLLGRGGEVMDTNPSFQKLFGYQLEEMEDLCTNLYPEESPSIISNFEKILSGETINAETVRKHKDGHLIPVSILGYPFMHKNEISGAFFIYNDISPRKEYERQLSHQALHDALTGLPNRTLFMERLDMALTRSQRDKNHTFAVLMLDLDLFKRINDSLGHLAGDQLLAETGRRIQKCVRSIDTTARMGGDEFAILIEDFNSPQQVIQIIKRIRNEIRLPVKVGDKEVFISSSIGIVFKTAKYSKPEHILRDADISMYKAKELGVNRFKVFNKAMHEKALKNLLIETEIREGLPGDQFYPYFQPVYGLSDSRLAGFEALVRWDHPKRGFVCPDEIIPIAEDTGLIVNIDRLVLLKACQCFSRWLKCYPESSRLFLNVNLSPRQLSRPDLIEAIENVLNETKFPPDMLKLEITEAAIMESNATTTSNLEKLVNLGIRLAVDDFGTGYSSLSQLQRFPASTVKIDRSFVVRMTQDNESLEIVKAVYALGHSLGMDIIAEGVEDRKQLSLLRSIGCEYVQGFYFDKPVNAYNAGEIIKLMSQGFKHPGLTGL